MSQDVVVRFVVERDWLDTGRWEAIAACASREAADREVEKVLQGAPSNGGWYNEGYRIRREEVYSRTVATVRVSKSRARCTLCKGPHEEGACREYDPHEDRLKC